jgi:hypothetical protein
MSAASLTRRPSAAPALPGFSDEILTLLDQAVAKAAKGLHTSLASERISPEGFTVTLEDLLSMLTSSTNKLRPGKQTDVLTAARVVGLDKFHAQMRAPVQRFTSVVVATTRAASGVFGGAAAAGGAPSPALTESEAVRIDQTDGGIKFLDDFTRAGLINKHREKVKEGDFASLIGDLLALTPETNKKGEDEALISFLKSVAEMVVHLTLHLDAGQTLSDKQKDALQGEADQAVRDYRIARAIAVGSKTAASAPAEAVKPAKKKPWYICC